MKPYLEKLLPAENASLTSLNRRLDARIPFQWHHHPEFELTMTLNSRGQRFIGDHLGNYDDGDLVLIGPNLPHSWSSVERIDASQPHRALVFWFTREWMENMIGGSVEFRGLKMLIARAELGLQFSNAAAEAVRADYGALFDASPMQQLLGLLGVLDRLCRDDAAQTLCANSDVGGSAGGRARIDRVLDHLHRAYAEEVKLEDLAGIAALSPSGLHRMFRRHTRSTISDYLMRLRIGDACSKLSASGKPIAAIAEEVGYRSLANFNRQFRQLRGMTPRDYRAMFQSR